MDVTYLEYEYFFSSLESNSSLQGEIRVEEQNWWDFPKVEKVSNSPIQVSYDQQQSYGKLTNERNEVVIGDGSKRDE